MTLLGIDYGSQRIGIAVSDVGEVLAFPHAILKNSKNLLAEVNDIVCEKNTRLIVLGKSEDLKGNDNPIMERITAFKEELERVTKLPVMFQAEFWSSQEARRYQGNGNPIDDSAAAIILQRFLDNQRAGHRP